MNDIILTAIIWLVILGLPIWFCIELIKNLEIIYPSLNPKNWGDKNGKN